MVMDATNALNTQVYVSVIDEAYLFYIVRDGILEVIGMGDGGH
jgi:hypothetical protein